MSKSAEEDADGKNPQCCSSLHGERRSKPDAQNFGGEGEEREAERQHQSRELACSGPTRGERPVAAAPSFGVRQRWQQRAEGRRRNQQKPVRCFGSTRVVAESGHTNDRSDDEPVDTPQGGAQSGRNRDPTRIAEHLAQSAPSGRNSPTSG